MTNGAGLPAPFTCSGVSESQMVNNLYLGILLVRFLADIGAVLGSGYRIVQIRYSRFDKRPSGVSAARKARRG